MQQRGNVQNLGSGRTTSLLAKNIQLATLHVAATLM